MLPLPENPIHLGVFRAKRNNCLSRLAGRLGRTAPDWLAAALMFGFILALPFVTG